MTLVRHWPVAVGNSGKVKDLKYNGCGWSMHFCNPDKPRSPISLQDVQQVRDFISTRGILNLCDPKISGPGVIQMSIGFAKGQGNVQIYTTKLGRSTGNARINIGNVEGLRSARSALLTSAWFHDAMEGFATPYGGKMHVTFQPEGKMILPPIKLDTSPVDLKSIFTSIYKKLGKAGKDVIGKYIDKAGLKESSVVKDMLNEIFGNKADPKSRSRKPLPGDA